MHDLRVTTPTLEPDDLFVARLSVLAATATAASVTSPGRGTSSLRIGLAAAGVAAIATGGAWLSGNLTGDETPSPTNPSTPSPVVPSAPRSSDETTPGGGTSGNVGTDPAPQDSSVAPGPDDPVPPAVPGSTVDPAPEDPGGPSGASDQPGQAATDHPGQPPGHHGQAGDHGRTGKHSRTDEPAAAEGRGRPVEHAVAESHGSDSGSVTRRVGRGSGAG